MRKLDTLSQQVKQLAQTARRTLPPSSSSSTASVLAESRLVGASALRDGRLPGVGNTAPTRTSLRSTATAQPRIAVPLRRGIVTVAVPDSPVEVTRQQVRLIAYLTVKALRGQPIDDAVTRRRLIDLTHSIGQVRRDVPMRGNGEDDLVTSQGDSARRHLVARALAAEAISHGHPVNPSLAASADLLSSGNCDDLNARLQPEHAGRLDPLDRLELVVSRKAPPAASATSATLPLPEDGSVDAARLALLRQAHERLALIGQPQPIVHKHHILTSASPDDGRPKVVGDPLAGVVNDPEPAVLLEDAYLHSFDQGETDAIGAEDAPRVTREYEQALGFLIDTYGDQLSDRLEEVEANAGAVAGIEGGWESMSIFDPAVAAQAREDVAKAEGADPAGLRETILAQAASVLGSPAPAGLVDLVIKEAKQLDRRGQAPATAG